MNDGRIVFSQIMDHFPRGDSSLAWTAIAAIIVSKPLHAWIGIIVNPYPISIPKFLLYKVAAVTIFPASSADDAAFASAVSNTNSRVWLGPAARREWAAKKLVGVVAAAAPVFVADADVFDFPGFFAAVLLAKIGHLAVAVKGQVFHPIHQFFRRTGTDVAGDIGLAAEQFAQIHELMRPEGVILDDHAPVGVDNARTFFARADAVLPVVFIG